MWEAAWAVNPFAFEKQKNCCRGGRSSKGVGTVWPGAGWGSAGVVGLDALDPEALPSLD